MGPLVLQEGYYSVLSGLGISSVVSGEELVSVNVWVMFYDNVILVHAVNQILLCTNLFSQTGATPVKVGEG